VKPIRNLPMDSDLGKALYALVHLAHETRSVTRETKGLVAELRAVVEGLPSGDSLRPVLSKDFIGLEGVPELAQAARSLWRVLPSSDATTPQQMHERTQR